MMSEPSSETMDVANAPAGAGTAGRAPRSRRAPRRWRKSVVAGLLVAALAATAACNVDVDGGRTRPIVPAPQSPSAQQPAASRGSQRAAPGAGTVPAAAPGTVEAAIQNVIARGNDEQVQAIASGNAKVMADTSTSRYYQELVQTNQDLLDNGVTGIKLVKLEWGPTQVNGNTATATTYETWRTTLDDGTTDESRDRNVYTLVRDGSTWRIDADDHPDDAQSAPGGSTGGAGRGTTIPPAPEPRAPQPQLPLAQNTSSNWSGYAAGGGTFTAVSGTWTVPQVS